MSDRRRSSRLMCRHVPGEQHHGRQTPPRRRPPRQPLARRETQPLRRRRLSHPRHLPRRPVLVVDSVQNWLPSASRCRVPAWRAGHVATAASWSAAVTSSTYNSSGGVLVNVGARGSQLGLQSRDGAVEVSRVDRRQQPADGVDAQAAPVNGEGDLGSSAFDVFDAVVVREVEPEERERPTQSEEKAA